MNNVETEQMDRNEIAGIGVDEEKLLSIYMFKNA